VEIDSPDIRRGNRQEPIAAEVYVEESGHPVEVVEEIIRHPVHDFMAASLDRMIQPEGIPLEIKCPRVATFFRWKQQGIPAGPLLQGQHYMAVLGVKQIIYAVFCAELDELLVIPVERDDELIERLIAREREFWGYVERKEAPPEVVPTPGDLPGINANIKRFDEHNFEWRKAVEDLRLAQKLTKQAKDLEDGAKDAVQGMMGPKIAIAEGAGERVSWTWQQGRKSLDRKALVKAHPEINFEDFMKPGKPYRTFRINRLALKGEVE